MSRSALRQVDLFKAPLHAGEIWLQKLYTAFQDTGGTAGYLPLAQKALQACPGDPQILLMATNAALLDGEPAQAQVFLKRFTKRATAPSAELLRAFTLHATGASAAAKAILERNGLVTWMEAYKHFPAGRAHVDWMFRQLNEILDHDKPVRRRAPLAKPASAKAKAPAKAKTKPPVKPAATDANRNPTAAALAEAPLLASLHLPAMTIPFALDIDLSALATAMTSTPEPAGRWFNLRQQLSQLGLAQGFDELLCLPQLTNIEPLWHQVETVRKVLKQFRGRVLLADEVGLGKTIEAGMVLKEYALRGMAERALVLTPASLVGQWREELDTKFGLTFTTTYDSLLRDDPDAFWAQPRIIASIASARRREHAERLAASKFDLVIVDEAHHLRDRSSASWKLVDALNKRFLLLLSATPVQNDLVELYNLLTLLKPGIFKTLTEFRAAHMTPGKPRQPANPEALRSLMRGVMIRNTRAVVALKLPRRHATTIKVDAAQEEREAYAALAEAARGLAAEGGGAGRNRLALQSLLGAAGSSPAAAAGAVARHAERNPKDKTWPALATRLAAITTGAKETALLDLLHKNPEEKKLVFVQSRETLEHLADRLTTERIGFARFDGSLTGPEKDAAITAFREHASVLLCTQSGGEGRNIQFCNTLINFDVPWNPMAIEQRIGRIDRIGQARDVFVFNLVTRGTIEEQVLLLLDEKISMFELVVGEAGAILGGLDEEREFPDLVLDAWLEETETGRTAAFDALGELLVAARRDHNGAKALDETLFGEDFETA